MGKYLEGLIHGKVPNFRRFLNMTDSDDLRELLPATFIVEKY